MFRSCCVWVWFWRVWLWGCQAAMVVGVAPWVWTRDWWVAIAVMIGSLAV